MAKDHEKSLGDQPTFDDGAKRVESSQRSLGDQSTFGGDASSMADLDGPGGDVGLDMEIVDLAARYTTEGTLGKGGMGEVLLATDTRLNRKVAIKRVLGKMARSQTALSRFLTEAQSIAALNHPNIVDIYDYGRTADGPFLIMEYVDGGSLLDRCREGAIPLAEAVELTCQLCSALDKAHAADIIHRDIKPANVLMSEDGTPILTDFGLAKDEAADTGQTMAGAVLGTLDFMPPEQRRDAALTDARSDLWSLAATLYQMVTGKSPKIIRFNDVPQALQDVLGKALEEEKNDRYQTAGEFGDALRVCLQDSGPDASDLGEGQCPHCGTKNDSSRKFCRNCAESLEVPCLSCDTRMPMWEDVCGNCGTKQSKLLEERRTKMGAHQSKAEGLLEDYDFAGATKLATQLRDEPDLRLQHLKGWGDQFLKTIEREKQSQQEHIATLLAEAEKHEQAYDYKAGIHALEQVPPALHSMSVSGHAETVKQVLHHLSQKRQKASRLDELIQQRVASKQLDGLDAEVRSLLELYPGREDLLTLQGQLVERQQKLELVRDEAVQSAQQFLKQQNYGGCIQQLDRIHSTLLTSEIKQLRDEAQDRLEEVHRLDKLIQQRIADKQLDGLDEQVEALLELNPERKDLLKLKGKLARRQQKLELVRDEAVQLAQQLLEQQNYEACLQQLGRINSTLLTSEIKRLRDDAQDRLDRSQKLRSTIDNAVQSKQLHGLLAKVKDYLALQSDDEPMQQLQTRLLAREKKNAAQIAQIIENADDLRVECQFDEACKALEKIPNHLLTNDADELLQNCAALSDERGQALKALHRAASQQEFKSGLKSAKEYRALLEAEQLEDGEFETRYQECQQALQDQQEAIAAAERHRKLIVKLSLAAAAVTAVGLLIGAGLWIRSSMRASAIAEALKKSDYDAVLALDGKNVKALIGRATKRLTSNTPDIDGALADLSFAEHLDSGAADLTKTKATAYAKRAVAQAAAGDLTAAERDIKQATSLGASGAVLQQANNGVAASHLLRDSADKLSAGDLDGATGDLIRAEELGAYTASVTPLKSQLASGLTSRFERSLNGKSYEQAAADYGLVSRLDAAAGRKLQSDIEKLPPTVLSQLPSSAWPVMENSVGMELNFLPGGTFMMGSESYSDELPIHEVTLSQAFYMGVYQVTQEQYERVIGKSPSEFKGRSNPVENVSWDDAVKFCEKLSSLPDEKSAGRVYRLPTEAEWEYACRAGTATDYSFGDDESQLGEYAWYDSTYGSKTHPVGQKRPNAWGLYDMHGNVQEWCQDWFGRYPSGSVADPTGPSSGSDRVYRGGSWHFSARYCRSADRDRNTPDFRYRGLGFRVVLSPSAAAGE